MSEFIQQVIFVGNGLTLTLAILVGALALGFILGLFWAICRTKGLAPFLVNRLISILRGTPVILQLSLVYFSVPIVLGIKISIVNAGIMAFGLNSSAYFAEIFRAGIESIPKGQFEAAATLHIKSYFLWKDIILPQVLANTSPALINEIIALLKETALISTIGGMDIMRHSQTLAAEQFTYFFPLCIAGIYYYCLVLLIEALGRYVSKRGMYVTS